MSRIFDLWLKVTSHYSIERSSIISDLNKGRFVIFGTKSLDEKWWEKLLDKNRPRLKGKQKGLRFFVSEKVILRSLRARELTMSRAWETDNWADFSPEISDPWASSLLFSFSFVLMSFSPRFFAKERKNLWVEFPIVNWAEKEMFFVLLQTRQKSLRKCRHKSASSISFSWRTSFSLSSDLAWDSLEKYCLFSCSTFAHFSSSERFRFSPGSHVSFSPFFRVRTIGPKSKKKDIFNLSF